MHFSTLTGLGACLASLTNAAPPPPAAAGPGTPAAGATSLKSTTWNPPANLKAALDAVWTRDMKKYSPQPDPLKFKNFGFNQVLANNGKLNFCVRWDSKTTATPETRRMIDAALKKQTKKWMDILVGFDGWPYQEVPVRVVGWAARSQSLLPGHNASEGMFYSDKDQTGIPQCAPACGRFFHQDGNYPGCPGGKDMHYDMSLWLTDGFRGGAGGDWGQRLSTEQFVNDVKSGKDSIHIFLHEMGHTFALDDYYDWTPPGQKNFIMMAGSAMFITEFDAWMMRDWWRHLKPRLLPKA